MPMMEMRRASFMMFTLPPAVYRSSPSCPAYSRPNTPWRMSSLVTMLMVMPPAPSSNPLNWAWSLCFSKTWILSTTSAGRFFSAMLGSSPKNSRPSTSTLFTFSPCTFRPSASCTTPGNLRIRSSALASGAVVKAPAWYWVVSPSCSTRVRTASTVTSRSSRAVCGITMVPRSRSPVPMRTLRSTGAWPTALAFSKWSPGAIGPIRKRPSMSVVPPLHRVLSSACATTMCTKGRGSRPALSAATRPVSMGPWAVAMPARAAIITAGAHR